MKNKLLIMMIIVLFVSSISLSFATNPYDSNIYSITINDGNTITSNSPFSRHLTYIASNGTWNLYGPTGNLILVNQLATTSLILSDSIVGSSHNIYETNDPTKVFFSLPTVWTQGLEGANLLSSILPILGIILGMLILAIGFRKAFSMVFRQLSRA